MDKKGIPKKFSTPSSEKPDSDVPYSPDKFDKTEDILEDAIQILGIKESMEFPNPRPMPYRADSREYFEAKEEFKVDRNFLPVDIRMFIRMFSMDDTYDEYLSENEEVPEDKTLQTFKESEGPDSIALDGYRGLKLNDFVGLNCIENNLVSLKKIELETTKQNQQTNQSIQQIDTSGHVQLLIENKSGNVLAYQVRVPEGLKATSDKKLGLLDIDEEIHVVIEIERPEPDDESGNPANEMFHYIMIEALPLKTVINAKLELFKFWMSEVANEESHKFFLSHYISGTSLTASDSDSITSVEFIPEDETELNSVLEITENMKKEFGFESLELGQIDDVDRLLAIYEFLLVYLSIIAIAGFCALFGKLIFPDP